MSLLNFEITNENVGHLAEIDNLNFNSTRTDILKSLNSIDVQACPGSGKTTLVSSKLILLSQIWSYKSRGICVLSHTNVAKDEIINKLERSKIPEARSLLAYPHFIGTIQEFINRHIAIPYLRSLGISITLIDTDRCVDLIYSRLSPRTKIYIDNKSQHENVLFDFNLKIKEGNLKVNVPTFPNGSQSPSYQELKKIRTDLIKEGYLFYRDLYVFAEKALLSTPSIPKYTQNRYPLVLIDEMQDTQKFQDDLLQTIFPLNSSSASIQRFGDPDQAIFNGINDEVPNESYNDKREAAMNFVINESHRFGNSVCSKISNFSFNQIDISSHITERAFSHTALVFDDSNIERVIPEFALIVAQQFPPEDRSSPNFVAKAVGAVGKDLTTENPKELKIASYWKNYNKNKDKKIKNSDHFIEAIFFIRQNNSKDWHENYKYLNDCVLKILRVSDIKSASGKLYNINSLKEYLSNKKAWHRYRKIAAWFLNSSNELTLEKWNKICRILIQLLSYPISEQAKKYLEYQEYSTQDLESSNIQNSLYLENIKISLSTIHGVKGETHDATLILETKNHCFDIETMLPYFSKELPSSEIPNSSLRGNPSHIARVKQNQRFMRQLYVGMSRPKHLLCIAIHKDRLSPEYRRKLEEQNWIIHEISNLQEAS